MRLQLIPLIKYNNPKCFWFVAFYCKKVLDKRDAGRLVFGYAPKMGQNVSDLGDRSDSVTKSNGKTGKPNLNSI
jgi:hypothetical protein